MNILHALVIPAVSAAFPAICTFFIFTILVILLKIIVSVIGLRNRDSVVSIVTRPRAGRFVVRIPAVARGFYFLQNFQKSSGAHPASFSVATGVFPRG